MNLIYQVLISLDASGKIYSKRMTYYYLKQIKLICFSMDRHGDWFYGVSTLVCMNQFSQITRFS